MEKKIYSVGELTGTIKNLLENSLPTIWLQGEISNFKKHYSGHLYFSLKDERAQISAVMWRTRAQTLMMDIEDGMQVRVLGNIRLYEKSGRYQIDIVQIVGIGAGQLQLAFERLKQKLLQEGLFDEARKKTLPRFPKIIAVVTSPTGAAIRDILNVLRRRAPYSRIIIRAAKVQGIGAAQDIADAIGEINAHTGADVMIIGRGGGSLEDLWAFNEETLARAISASAIPVISAVGHEIDFTIADFCADLRAPTPSAAAELVCEDAAALDENLRFMRGRLFQEMMHQIQFYRHKLQSYQKSYGLRRLDDLLYQYKNRVVELQGRLVGLTRQNMQNLHDRIGGMAKTLENLNPANILKRGYSLTTYRGKILRDVSLLKEQDIIVTQVQTGHIESIVKHLQSEAEDGKKTTI